MDDPLKNLYSIKKDLEEMHTRAYIQELYSKRMEELGERCLETEDGNLAMTILFNCMLFEIPIPESAQKVFMRLYEKIRSCQAGSWDEVFGKPFPKGTHVGAKRQWIEKAPSIHLRIKEMIEDEGTAIDDGLFEQVGKAFGVSKTVAKDYYYGIERDRARMRERAVQLENNNKSES